MSSKQKCIFVKKKNERKKVRRKVKIKENFKEWKKVEDYELKKKQEKRKRIDTECEEERKI